MKKDQHQAEAHLEQVKKLDKALGTNRGIETMFRSAYRVQMDLTSLADNKANMMISINGPRTSRRNTTPSFSGETSKWNPWTYPPSSWPVNASS